MKFISKVTIFLIAASFSFEASAQIKDILPSKTSVEPAVSLSQLKDLIYKNQFISDYKRTIEINLIKLTGKKEHVKSDGGLGEIFSFDDKSKSSTIKTIPLEFRFELENNSWGLLSDIDFKKSAADIGLYNIVNNFKLGAGLLISHESEQSKVEMKKIKQAGSVSITSRQISPYFLLKKNLAEEDSYSFEYWGKAGVEFSSKKSEDLKINYTALFLNPGFDYFYNISRYFSLGTGFNLKYSILNGSVDNFKDKIDGSGESLSYQLGLFKLKYIF